jgi:uncharacterized membrane protein HdeD (DUF308 family)
MSEKSPWWLGLVQGLVALGLGLYLVFSRDSATFIIGTLAAIYLVVAGAIQTIRGRGLQSAGKGSIVLIRGVVGLVFGIVLLALALLSIGSLSAGFTILAIALIIFGALGVYTSLFQRGGRKFDWGPVLVNLALLAWGVLVFFSRAQGFDLTRMSGWILIAVGAIILLWTFLTRSQESDDPAAVP